MTWADIVEFPGYKASSDGEIISCLRGSPKILKPYLNPITGYLQVSLRKNGKTYVRKVHVLVALAFIGPKPWGMEVIRYDRDKLNNSLLNLEYDTHSTHASDQVADGTHYEAKRRYCDNGHEYTQQNTGWRRGPRGQKYRRCRKCHATYVSRWRAKKALARRHGPQE